MARHKAVQAVSTVRTTLNGEETTKLDVKREPLRLLSEQIGDRKVAIISIAGTFRTGKGFLFSLFVIFLEWLVDGAKGSWIDLKKKIDSFHWKSGSDGDTKGIYVYNKPFIIKTKTGDEIAIILMDTQGTYDTQLTGKEVSSIFALSTMLSSVQIYNLKNNINMPDLQHLAFFTHLASLSKQTAEGDGKIFQSLYFLIRDWSNPSEKKFGAEGGDKLVQKVLEEHSTRNSEVQEICTTLKDNFETVNGYLLPSPGETVAVDNHSNRTLEEMQIKQDFLNHAFDLFSKLISNAKPKMIENRPLEGISLLNIFEQYVEAFQGNTVPQPDSMLKSVNRVGCMNAKDCALKQYHHIMDNILTESSNMDEGSLINAHYDASAIAFSTFDSIIPKGCVMNADEVRQKLVEILEDQFKLALLDITTGNIEKMKSRFKILACAGVIAAAGCGVGLVVGAIPAVASVITPEALLVATQLSVQIITTMVKTKQE